VKLVEKRLFASDKLGVRSSVNYWALNDQRHFEGLAAIRGGRNGHCHQQRIGKADRGLEQYSSPKMFLQSNIVDLLIF